MQKEEKQWYAIHTYSGYEDQVADQLKQRTESMDMKDNWLVGRDLNV